MKKLRAMWQSLWGDVDRRIRLGRILGLVFVTLGFILIGLGWNGAAGQNIIMAQFPYLLSGGIMGLALVLTGGLMLFLATVRAERQVMSDKFDEVARLLGRNLGRLQLSTNGSSEAAVQVVATETNYHLADCRLLEGKEGLTTVTLEQAGNEGLQPCRVCDPPRMPEKKEEATPETPAPTI